MRHSFLSLVGFAAAILVIFAGAATASAQTPPLTVEVLKNATYPVDSVPGGSAKLVNGSFSVAAAPGSASMAVVTFLTSAIGTIGGQPGAAVVLVSSGGGTGQFVDLYAVDATGKTVAKTGLGDRIKVESLSIDAAGRIAVDLMVRGANEPLSSPATLPEHRDYTLANGALTRVAPATVPAAPVAPRPAPTGNAGPAATHTTALLEVAALALAILGVATARRTVRAG